MFKRTSGPGGLVTFDHSDTAQNNNPSQFEHGQLNYATSTTGSHVDSSHLAEEESEKRERDILEHSGDIFYSKRYSDDHYEYRHVILPKQISKYYKADRLLSEVEWRSLGIQQSPGWVHYMIHKPEPHVLLFRRDLGISQNSSQSNTNTL